MTDSYGVLEKDDDLEYHLKSLSRNGFTIIKSGFNSLEIAEILKTVKAVSCQYFEKHSKVFLQSIDEHNTVRAPFLKDPIFLKVMFNCNLMSVVQKVLHNNFYINQQNIIVNPGDSRGYNQLFWHRDLPYQHFVSSRPISLNALYCVCDFTLDNGTTQVLPGSHLHEKFPSDRYVEENKKQFFVSAGDYLLIDSMLYHSGGINKTNFERIGINNVYTTPIIRRQIDFNREDFYYDPTLFLEEKYREYLGLNFFSCKSVTEFLKSRVK